MAGSPFSGEEYYSGTETDDVAWIRRFIVKNANQKSRRIAQFEVQRLEAIMERLVLSNEKTDLSKENDDLRGIISELNEKYLKVNKQNESLVINTNTQNPPQENRSNTVNGQIKVNNNAGDTIILMCIAIPMMLIYMFDWTFWGSKICLGIGWFLFLIMGLGSLASD